MDMLRNWNERSLCLNRIQYCPLQKQGHTGHPRNSTRTMQLLKYRMHNLLQGDMICIYVFNFFNSIILFKILTGFAGCRRSSYIAVILTSNRAEVGCNKNQNNNQSFFAHHNLISLIQYLQTLEILVKQNIFVLYRIRINFMIINVISL